MNRFTKCAMVCLVALVLLGAAGRVYADTVGSGGDIFAITFDENGHATASVNGGPATPVAFVIQVDPNTGVPALTYVLPQGPVGAGCCVDVFEPTGALSDALSFYNVGSQAFMAYYSELDTTEAPDLAELVNNGFVPNNSLVSLTEVGPEGNNGFAFFSGGVQGANNDYFGISDTSIPEPASLLLLGTGLAGFVARRRKALH